MRYILFLLSCAAICKRTSAQIVNIESKRIQSDSIGWLGNIGSSFLFEKNAIEVINISANAHVEYKSKKSLYLFLVNYNLLKGDAQTLNNNLFLHLRYNYKINKWLRWELFGQVQENRITGIKQRWLVGSGPRVKLLGNDSVALYAATSVMYEYEEEQTVPVIYHRDVRSSSYISFDYKFLKNAELIATVFYQPLFNNFADFRILNEIGIKFKFVKHFSFSTNWYYLYDSRPAASTPKLNYSISNGIEYDF